MFRIKLDNWYTNDLCILYYYSFARESIREEDKEGHIPREENDNTCKKKMVFSNFWTIEADTWQFYYVYSCL